MTEKRSEILRLHIKFFNGTKKLRNPKQILETQLTIGKNRPVDFAKLYTKQEVVYIIKCQAVEVSIREEKECFQELPVTYGEDNYFMSPHNHILLKHGSPITCSNLVPPIFFVASKWWAITPEMELFNQLIPPKTDRDLEDVGYDTVDTTTTVSGAAELNND
ncbi:CLUMA_CG016126, isoform A [Clunio marinus]|uniref:CLUMA_CG016126, isoform A n=1 Tax=Clunio marinus TaxID=568069 RepID=A0A1J1IT30_9DIPT|nr:CLUMA_CG016126, isoform A [Clunio marinus]